MAFPAVPKKGSMKSKRLHVVASLIAAYLNLSENGRVRLESHLADHAYSISRFESYTPDYSSGCDESCDCPDRAVYDSLCNFAAIINKAVLWPFERGEALREALGVLISVKNEKRALTEQELLEAAERALDWTAWDEHNRKIDRVRKSPEYKACMDQIASHRNPEGAMKRWIELETSV